MSLRARVNLLLSLIFTSALAVAVTYLLTDARRAVLDEAHASTVLASALVQGMLDGPLAGMDEAAVADRLDTLSGLRHLRLSHVTDERSATDRVAAVPPAPTDVPAWFTRLVRPQPGVVTATVPWRTGTIVIVADAGDEIAEAWRETRTGLLVLLAVFVGVLLAVFAFLGRALAPLHDVSRALEGVERGEFGLRLPAVGLPDIDALAERFNHMADALARSQADNAYLAQRSLEIQEDERRYLAHELHDEMGQSITAIKALAVSMQERARDHDVTLADRAGVIVDVSSTIYARVRQMMTRLHPVILDELGLVTALAAMIDDWNTHHEECFCHFQPARALPELNQTARINLYRIVQEGLTNVARHAGATEARVSLDLEAGEPPCLRLEVSDNGVGFAPGARRAGLGLPGMRERVAALGGSLVLTTAPGAGTHYLVRVPCTARAMTMHEGADGDAHPAG